MDLLEELLRSLRGGNEHSALSYLDEPWGLVFQDQPDLRIHVVVRGRAFATVGNGIPIALGTGDAVLVNGGATHQLVAPENQQPGALIDGPGRVRARGEPPQNAGDRWRTAHPRSYGSGPSAPTHVLHAAYSVENPFPRRLLSGISATTVVPRRFLPAALRALIVEQAVDTQPAHNVLLAGSMDLLLGYALRAAVEEGSAQSSAGWYRASRDMHLAPALDAMHEGPSKRWTLDSLAKLCGVSRATFASKFRQTMASTPASYLRTYRVERAIELLQSTDLSLERIAPLVGYADAYGLSNAVQQVTGLRPSQHRKSASRR